MKNINSICSVLLFVVFACQGIDDKASKPNIILIYADDLGIGLLEHEGQQIIKTPNIDKLASEGIRFSNAYSCMLCAPARASLITGLHDCHNPGFEISSAGIYKKISTGERTQQEIEELINSRLSPIPDKQIFLAQAAKKAGYTTGQIGKLEWGFATTHSQLKRHGWDYYFGYMDHVRAHGFYPPFLFKNGDIVEYKGNKLINCGKTGEPETNDVYNKRWDMSNKETYSQTVFMEAALEFIKTNKDRPFFLYFPTQLPHGPVAIPEVHSDFVNDKRLTEIEKEYASMVKLLDDNIGEIMHSLKELKIDDNTIVIFTSDNGHEIYYTQEGRIIKPYTNISTGERFDNIQNKYYSNLSGDVFDGNGGRAGLKRSNLEGGIKVPLLIRWPAKIKPASESLRLTANYDLLSSIAELGGYKGELVTDGLSFAGELVQGNHNKKQHEYILFSSFEGPVIITNDGWKLRSLIAHNRFELYYLPDDFREESDLSLQYPEKFSSLKELMLQSCDQDLKNGHYRTSNQIRIE